MRFLPTALVALATAAEIVNAQRVHVSHRQTKMIRGESGGNRSRDLQKAPAPCTGCTKRPSPAPVAAPAPQTKRPSPAPFESPTIAPVANPTVAPVADPTAAPVTSSSQEYGIPSPSEIVRGDDSVLFTTIWIEQATYTIPGTDFSITARLLNGEYPGPTLRIQPGDTLDILFENDLVDTGSVYVHNEYSGNDISNMHFHGLHVSGELPSDDVTFKVYPGESYNYITTLPDEHMPGTHWQHPHVHGSTSLQVGGGAFQAIIVEDPDGFVPDQVANAREVLFLAHYWHLNEMDQVVAANGDTVFSHTMTNQQRLTFQEFVTVNGQYQPEIYVDANEWIRLRVLWANFRQGDLDLGVDGCEMQLLAKDGIYIQDFPRLITDANVVPGGRADVMVRCTQPDTTYTINGIVDSIATIRTSSITVASDDLESWTPTYPAYLSDLTGETVTSGCECDTVFSGATMSVNEIPFPEDGSYLHRTYIGAINARNLVANAHPYHQHVYPFQIVSETLETGYNKVGDWHDTLKGTGEVRYRPTEFTGKLMLHCHRLIHEDLGMMAMEYVGSSAEATCSCTSRQGTR